MQERLKGQIYEPQEQQSSLVLPRDEEATPQNPFLTERDLPFFTKEPSPQASPSSLPSSSLPSAQSTSLSPGSAATSLDDEPASWPSTLQNTLSQGIASDSPQQAQHEPQREVTRHAGANAGTQAPPPGAQPQADWASTPTEADPISNLGSPTSAGSAPAVGSEQPESQSYSSESLGGLHWHAANVVPEGLMLQPQLGQVGLPLLQTPSQLPVFALDALLWPNQMMMLRQVQL